MFGTSTHQNEINTQAFQLLKKEKVTRRVTIDQLNVFTSCDLALVRRILVAHPDRATEAIEVFDIARFRSLPMEPQGGETDLIVLVADSKDIETQERVRRSVYEALHRYSA